MNIEKVLLRQFEKKELLEICEELDLDINYSTSSKVMINAILDDIEDNGVPASEDCSSKLEDLLVIAGYVDEEGNLLDEDEYDETDDEEVEAVEVEISRPQCFSFYSDRDPACKRCPVSPACKTKKLEIMPECYGKLFDQRLEECKGCMENMSCRELVQIKE